MIKQIPEDAKLIPDQAELKYEGVIFSLYSWPQLMLDGTHATYEMIKRSDTAAIIPVVKDELLLIHSYQPFNGQEMAFPGGLIDKTDSTTLDGAKRELKEETGYEFNKFKLVDVKQPDIKSERFIYIYVAWDVKSISEIHSEPGEKTTTALASLKEVKELTVKGQDSFIYYQNMFSKINRLDDLLKLPQFKGKTVDR